MKRKSFELVIVILIFICNYPSIAQEGKQKEVQDNIKDWYEGENFDDIVKDGILLASLIQVYDEKHENIFNRSGDNNLLARAMLIALAKKYEIGKFDWRPNLVLPGDVISNFNGDLVIYSSKETWFNPVNLFLKHAGKLSNLEIRKGGYSIYMDEIFKVKIEDGLEAKLNGKYQTFERGDWIEPEMLQRLAMQNSCLKIKEILPGNPDNQLPGVLVKNGSYEIFESEYKTTGIKITGNEGGLEARGGLPGGAEDNSIYKFIGKSTIILGSGSVFVFEGDPFHPITFVLSSLDGFVYLEGKGKVVLSDKSTIRLPCENNKK